MAQLEDLLQQCTVQITIPGQRSWGTGFLVAPSLILTCAHVVKALALGATVQIRWQQQTDFATAELIQLVPNLDLALLRFTPPNAALPCVYLDEALQTGQELYFFGYPDQDFDHGCPVTGSCEGFTGDVPPLIKFKQAQVRPGMSGSALLNRYTGKVCGMVKFTRDRSIDLGGGAIPTRVILEQLPELRSLQQSFHGGDRRWVSLITPPGVDFQPYLNSVATTYAKWQQYYTLTDAEGKQRQVEESAPLFDFVELMAQTVPKQEREPPQQEKQDKEKVERFSVLDGLRKYALGEKPESVLLVGRPGSGKSTALAKLLLEEARSQTSEVLETSEVLAHSPRIPVLVELRYWQGSIAQLILDALHRHELAVSNEQLEAVLAKVILLFDGVNELPSNEARTELIAFRHNHPKLPMIFTTRDLSLGGDLGIERKLEMLPLTEPQMQAFIRAYIPEQSEVMLRQLKDRLREFGQTPLLLWMLCEVFKQSPIQQLPNNLGGIFQVFTRTYEDSSVRKHEVAALKGDVKPLTHRRLWKKALMAIAAIMMQGKTPADFRVAIHRDEAERELSRVFPNELFPVRDILDDLLKYHLLQNQTADQIEFRHQLIQEYYAAEYLLRLLQPPDGKPELTDDQLKQAYVNYLKWTEPVALMLALVADKGLAVRLVEQALDVDLILGARLAGEVKPEFQEQTVELLNRLIEQKNLPEWLRVELWGRTRSDVILPKMLQALNNSNVEIARTAAAVIGRTNNQTAIDLLTSRLEEIDSRFFAQTSFGGSDRTGEIWTVHVEALSYIAPQRAVQFLRNKLDPINGHRHIILTMLTGASELLMKLDGEALFPELIEQLKNVESEHRKNHILNIISSANKYTHELFIPRLIQALEEEEIQSIQVRLIKLIGELTSDLVTQTFVRLIAQSAQPKLRQEITKQLIQREVQDFTQLEELLTHENLDVAYSAAFVLGHLGKTSALRTLSNIVRSHNPSTPPSSSFEEFIQTQKRVMAAAALGLINHEESISCLLYALNTDDNQYVRREAAFSLSNLSRREAIPELLIALYADYIDARTHGIRGLAKLGVKEPLWDMLRTKATCWQTAAVELGKLGEIEVLPYLRQALADLGFESSNEVIHLLAKFADVETCNWLVDALNNPEPHQTDQYFCNRIAFVLVECRPEIVGSCLPALKEIIARSYVRQIFWLIPAIQANCNFYNCETFQAYLTTQNVDRKTHSNSDRAIADAITIKTVESLTIMTDKSPIFNQQHATIGVNYAADGSKIEFTQHTSSSEQTFEILLVDYKQFIEQLQQKYSTLADPTTVPQIIEVEAKLLEAQNQQRWQNFLNLKRLWHGSKKAGIKVGEHFAENNVWAKGAIAFLEGVSEDGK